MKTLASIKGLKKIRDLSSGWSFDKVVKVQVGVSLNLTSVFGLDFSPTRVGLPSLSLVFSPLVATTSDVPISDNSTNLLEMGWCGPGGNLLLELNFEHFEVD